MTKWLGWPVKPGFTVRTDIDAPFHQDEMIIWLAANTYLFSCQTRIMQSASVDSSSRWFYATYHARYHFELGIIFSYCETTVKQDYVIY